MDDRELEARLGTYLHRRYDDAQPAPELASSVEQLFATEPRSVSLSGLGVRSPLRLGFSLSAVVVAVVVLVVAAANLGLRLGPTSGASPSPSGGPTDRTFIVLPPSAAVPSKADSSAAVEVLMARLGALGAGNVTGSGGYGMTFTLLDPDGPTDDQVRTVLAAPGIVQFVRIPAGNPAVEDGQVLPSAMPVLFGSEGVASVRDGSDQNGNPALNFNLTPAAAQLFADYTANHIREQLAIVLDGRVAAAPIIQSQISGGSVQITNESTSAGLAISAAIRAVLLGGPLPTSWRGASVPSVISKDEATARALNGLVGVAAVRNVALDAQQVAGGWRAVWSVRVDGTFPALECSGPGTPCPPIDRMVVVVDAVSGVVLGGESPSP